MALPIGGGYVVGSESYSFGGQAQGAGANGRFSTDPQDWLSFQQQQAGVPDIFQIALNQQNQTVVFRIGTTLVGHGRKQVAGYNIHFIASSLVSSSTLLSLEGQTAAFRLSDIVASTGAPGPGGVATTSSSSQYGKAGWYFAAAITQSGQESRYFAGPINAPMPGNIVTSQTPPNVSGQALSVVTESKNGRSVRKITVSALVPSVGQGVVAIFLENVGSGYTPNSSVPVVFTGGGGGSGAAATAVINSGGGVSRVEVSETGNGYFSIPTATAPPGSAVLRVVVGDSADFHGYQMYIENYMGIGIPVEGPIVDILKDTPTPGSVLRGQFYLLPDSPPFGADITFYFVSISSAGARRVDPTAAPSYVLVGGLT